MKPGQTGKGTWVTRMNPEGKGYPDYTAVHEGKQRLLFIELKDDYSQTSEAQDEWLTDLRECIRMITFTPTVKGRVPGGEADLGLFPSFEVHIWRPKMIEEIAELLK